MSNVCTVVLYVLNDLEDHYLQIWRPKAVMYPGNGILFQTEASAN